MSPTPSQSTRYILQCPMLLPEANEGIAVADLTVVMPAIVAKDEPRFVGFHRAHQNARIMRHVEKSS